MENEVLFLNNEEVKRVLTRKKVLDCVEDTFKSIGKGRVRLAREEPLWLDDQCDNMLLAMPGCLPDYGIAGLKWINMFFKQEQGFPSSHGNLIILNNMKNGGPFALIEAGAITTMRTGGGHAIIAAKHLGKKEIRRVTIIGGGEEGRSAAESAMLLFSLESLHFCDISKESCHRCEKEFEDRVETKTYQDAGEASDGSDLVILATTCKKVLFREEMAQPGMTIIGLNAFYDLDPAFASGKYKWFLGNRKSDYHQIIEDPELGKYGLNKNQVTGDLSELITKKVIGRENDQEIIVYTHMGMGVLDLMCANQAYIAAKELGIGQKLILNG